MVRFRNSANWIANASQPSLELRPSIAIVATGAARVELGAVVLMCEPRSTWQRFHQFAAIPLLGRFGSVFAPPARSAASRESRAFVNS